MTGYGRPRVRTDSPLNVESDLSAGHDLLTPAGVHFIRSHFEIPTGLDGGRLVVDGEVDRALTLTVDDLRAMAADTVMTTMECAGNSRAQLDPPVAGVQWVAGAVGTAAWRGVQLGRLLAMAGVRDGADAVLCAERTTAPFRTAPAGSWTSISSGASPSRRRWPRRR